MKKQKREPWLDEHGQQYPDAQLKIISKKWDEKTWDNYLKATVDVPLREIHLEHGHDAESYSQEEHEKFYQDVGNTKARPYFTHALEKIMRELPRKEALVIRMFFRQGMKSEEIAKVLNVDRATVYRTNKRALSKIKQDLKNIGNSFNGGI